MARQPMLSPTTYGALFAGLLFLGIILFIDVGRRMGLRRLEQQGEGPRQGFGTVEGALFALLGLMIAFTFSGAASRFDARRHLIIEEANAIGTAWLRLDLLPAGAQPALRDLFRRYLDLRLAVYDKLPDLKAAEAQLAESVKVQAEIWKHGVAACESKHDPSVTSLVLSSFNAMIDTAATRTETSRIHPPLIIFTLLFVLGLGCSLLAGFGMAGTKARSWTHVIGFAGVLAVTVYVIIEIEYPRAGLIQLDNMDRVLIELRESMN